MEGSGGGEQQNGQQQGAPPPAAGDGGGGAASPPARPDWLPEKFWDPQAAAPRVEQLAKSYGELEKQRAKFADEAKASARDAVMAELFGKRPETPDAYELGAPEDADDIVLLTEPPGDDFAPEPGKAYVLLEKDNPLLGKFRQLAHRAGLDATEFKAYLADFGRALAGRVPTAEEIQAEHAKIYQALGEHGERRVQHLQGQIKGLLGEQAEAVLGLPPSPQLIEALELLVERAGAPRFSPPSGAAGGRLTEAELREKMRDPRYHDPLRRDPAFVAEIERGWKTLYPN